MVTPTLESRDAHYDVVLAALIDDGASIVRDLAGEDVSAIDKAEPYERLARAIRRTIVLARHIAQNPLKIRQPAAEPTGTGSAPRRSSAQPGARPRDPDAEPLRPESPERLDDDLAADFEITRHPIDAAIANIRRDLAQAEAPPKPARFARPDLLEPGFDDDDDLLLCDTVRPRTKIPDG